jgi:hypothetical protein
MSYHERPEISASKLKLIDSDGWRAYEGRYITGTIPPPPPTDATDFGQVLETVMLEPDRVDARVFVGPAKEDYRGVLVTMDDLRAFCKANGLKPGTRKADAIRAIRSSGFDVPIWDEIRAEADEARGNRIEVTPQQYADILEIVALAKHDSNARWLFHPSRVVQPEAFWEHEASGLKCRGRADVWLPEQRIVLDVKSTRRTTPGGCIKDCIELGYWLQNSQYREGWKAEHFYFLFFTKSRPFRIFCIDWSMEHSAFDEYRAAILCELSDRIKTNDWSEDTEGRLLPATAPSWWSKQQGERYGIS